MSKNNETSVQVEIIESNDNSILQRQINEFLLGLGPDDVIDIKFTTKICDSHTKAMIIYNDYLNEKQCDSWMIKNEKCDFY